MELYRTILLPVDGSATASRAVEHALLLARCMDAQLLILYVVNTPEARTLGAYAAQAIAQMRKEGDQIGQQITTTARAAGLQHVRSLIEEGAPRRVIPQVAEELGADIIVMGTRGVSNVERALGSVTQYILAHCKVPVLVVQ